ncbi:MAG: anthranilate phosphoribosyltransferase [Prevotellaceae bacterium]|nr:anthranilate phosphoribosyltransferase [Prevotellaceae bacterium]
MKKYLLRLIDGATLSREDTHEIMLAITQEKYNVQQIAALLMALQTRGVTVDELLGFRDGLLETGKHIDLAGEDTIDIVGTGGDGKNTFNISTCSAFVIAGAGHKVTKHGNFGSTSVSGASNILQEFGAKFSDDADVLRRSLDEAGICYFHAPLFAYGMKFVGPTRKALAVPTCFNLLGPLVNPCHPKSSLHGTATQEQLRLYNNVHQRIGDNYGIVTSHDGYDEVSLTGSFKFVLNNQDWVLGPADLGLSRVDPRELSGGSTIAEAKSVFASVLEGTSTEAQKSVVLANSACAISVMDHSLSLPESVAQARESLESGRALQVFRKFLELNA